MNQDDMRFQIAAARRILFREGCDSQVGGQVSVRVPGEEALWTTVIEEFDETLPDQVFKVDFDGKQLEGAPATRPISVAVEFHAGIYRERPDVNAVVHHHGHFTSVVAATGEPVGAYHVTAYHFVDDQAYIFDDEKGLTFDDKQLPYALGEKNVLLMKNHGCVVVGPSLEVATAKAALLEIAARYHVDARQVGGTELLDKEMIGAYTAMGHIQFSEMWASRYRKLSRSDPDLFEWLAAH